MTFINVFAMPNPMNAIEKQTRTSNLSCHRLFPVLLIACFLSLIYWNSLETEWQMDDRPNIIDNPGLRIDNLHPESLWRTFFANQGKSSALFRPLPCLTFALNWYAGGDNPFGYHVVNLLFHFATAWVLYLLMARLLAESSRHLKDDVEAVPSIAMLAVVLWAANPIQTQAVTYIVQRMAVMAALFYVAGMLFYVKARTEASRCKQWTDFFLCGLCFLCSLGSKENGILLPVSLLLVEWIFFHHGSLHFFREPKMLALGAALIGGGLLSFFLFLETSDYIISIYNDRSFTMMERGLTQPRIVLSYLTQIALPLPKRLSIAHDVELSTSLFHPPTTLPAIVLVAGLVVFSVAYAKKFPLGAFAILFFFLNHVVESTVLPLELVFEHRNYLPSIFLFLPVSAVLYRVLTTSGNFTLVRKGIAGLMAAILMGLGLCTHERNKAWATSESLWRDAAIKAPNSIRPLVTLGIQLGWRDNATPADYRHALVLFRRALALTLNRKTERADILGNMATVHVFQGDYAKAVDLYRQALMVDPKHHKNRADLITPLILEGRLDEAQREAHRLVADRPDNPEYWNLSGFIFLWQEKEKEALSRFQQAYLKRYPNMMLDTNMGLSLLRSGYPEKSRKFLRWSIRQSPRDPIPLLAMMENRLSASDDAEAKKYALQLITLLPAPVLVDLLDTLPNNRRYPPIKVRMIRPLIASVMSEVEKKLER